MYLKGTWAVMYNTYMRFEVPQFIEIEDKIFGPFTWKQFVYLGGGVGFAVVLFVTTSFLFFVFLGVPVAALAAALAFYPVNNRPFSIFLESMFGFYKKNRMYYWRRKSNVVYKQTNASELGEPSTLVQPVSGKNNINSLSRKLELNSLEGEK